MQTKHTLRELNSVDWIKYVSVIMCQISMDKKTKIKSF